MEIELEEILKQADDVKISLSIIKLHTGYHKMASSKYLPLESEILLNPVLSKREFGITFISEIYRHIFNTNNTTLDLWDKKYLTEKYAKYTYDIYSEEIDKYLIERGLL